MEIWMFRRQIPNMLRKTCWVANIVLLPHGYDALTMKMAL